VTQLRDTIRRRGLLLILATYLALGVTYALATPVLEASDEYKHYPVVQYVQQRRALPVLDPAAPGRWLQEGAQPPLYYLLMAALTAPIDTSDLPALHQVNEHAFIGNPNQVGNKNLILHDPAREAFPWQGSVAAIYLIRFASLLLGAGTVLVTARLGVRFGDDRLALLAAALVAFNPMFLFVHTAVNNDSLAILLGSMGIYLLVRVWHDAPDPKSEWRRYVSLGIVVGLGMLTKLSLGGLLLLAGITLAVLAWQRRRYALFFAGGPLILFPALLLLAPWLWRNWQLYGDITALNVFVAVQGSRLAPLPWQGWLEEWGTFYRSFWGLFGGVNVAAPQTLYGFYNALAILAAAGLLGRRWRCTPAASGWWLLLAWPLLLFLLLVRWNAISPAFQGRLLFPSIAALGVAGAAGLLWWQCRLGIRHLGLGLGVLLLVIAALLPWVTIRPAYAYPVPIAEVPADARFGPMTFSGPEGTIELVGVKMPAEQSVLPGGEPVTVTLYWRAATPITADYLVAVSLLGRDLEPVARVTRHPAGGMLPTSRWAPGTIWRDVHHLFVDDGAPAPALLRVRASLYDAEQGGDLPVSSPGGTPVPLLLVGAARLAAAEPEPAPPGLLDVDFAGRVSLWGYALSPEPVTPGDSLALDLYWRAHGVPAADYTVFVHLLDASGTQVANADGPPVGGDYPTSWWRAGDIVDDRHLLDLPADLIPGDFTVAVGLYEPGSGERLQLADGGDTVRIALQIAPGSQ
jgi:4-amino-4-deoxy-L-arabinose transferase-like glycosyltransferase